MVGSWRGGNKTALGRKLRFERLEDRRLLSAAWANQPVISDSAGHLFAVDVNSSTVLTPMGTMSEVMLDIGFTPSGTLLGVKQITTASSLVTAGLFAIPVDLENPTTNVPATLLGAITYNGGAVSLNSLDVRSDGTVFAAGTSSGHGYLFALTAGTTDTVMAAVAADLGSYTPAGDLTFDSSGNIYLSTTGSGGHLLKIDSTLSTVTDLGATGYTNFMGLSHGSGFTVLGFRQDGGVYMLDPDTAQATSLLTLSGEGLTAIYGAAAVPESPLGLGYVEFRTLAAEQAFGGNAVYGFTANRDGLLTAELVGAASGTDGQFTLYSQSDAGLLTEVGTKSGTRMDLSVDGGQRYVLVLAGTPATFELRLTNLVSQSGGATTVYGTAGDDVFTFTAGTPYGFTINGVPYPYDSLPAQAAVLTFQGGDGVNTSRLTGGASAGTTTFSLQDYTGSYVVAGLEVHLSNSMVMTYVGVGAADTASLTGSIHVDTITLSPQAAQIVYPSSSTAQVTGVPHISVDGGGSNDRATFSGGPQALTATINFRQAQFVATDGSYDIDLSSVKTITAKAGSSGADLAIMTGSTGDDKLVSTSKYVSMFATAFSNAANGFPNVRAYGGGGNDSASMTDGSGNNQFIATPSQATLKSSAYSVQVNQFSSVVATAIFGAFDSAFLYGSTGNDIFNSTPTWATLSGTGYFLRVRLFDMVFANSEGGSDTAVMKGSSGNDTFVGHMGDSVLYGSGFYVRAKAFQQVYASGGAGGTDEATLYGSAGNDALIASGKTAGFWIADHSYGNQVSGFDTVTVISSGGSDTKKIGTLVYTLVLQGF